MLMRRLRARVGDPNHLPICIGTSATMASEGIEDDRNQIVAGVASRLFGTVIARDAIVTETLKRATNPERSADEGLTELGTSVRRAADETPYDGKSNEEIALEAFAIWVETRLGLKEVNRKPLRASPKSLKEAAALLHNECGQNLSVCEAALKNCLLAFSLSEGALGVAGGSDEPLFAFKLHQFISGAGRLYATLDHAGSRSVTFDGQVFDPTHPDKRVFATQFCRRCGQEHHPVDALDEMGTTRFEKREIDDVPINDDDDTDGAASRWGFLMPEPVDGVLNSFSGVGQYEPTDPELLAVYRLIVNGQKPHQTHLCRQLDVSQEIYVEWLRLIFVLLMQTGDDRPNLFEGMIKGLFEARDTQAAAFVWTYDQDVCLLSDRSYCQSIPDGAHMAMSFNLCFTAFVDYIFADAAILVEGRAAPAFVANALAAWRQRPQATINVRVTKNNRPMLARYNRRVIEQTRERVYCAEKTGIVLA